MQLRRPREPEAFAMTWIMTLIVFPDIIVSSSCQWPDCGIVTVQSMLLPVLKTSSFKECCSDHEKNVIRKLLFPSADEGADISKETCCPLANIQLYSPSATMSTVLS